MGLYLGNPRLLICALFHFVLEARKNVSCICQVFNMLGGF